MADEVHTSGQEIVFCHRCHNEWHQARHGLKCPQCDSEAVEVIELGSDPRDDRLGDDSEDPDLHMDRLPQHLLHRVNPWAREAPDPDEGDIEHVEWNAGPGLSFSRTSYRSSSPHVVLSGHRSNDPFAPLFQSLSNMFEEMQRPPNRVGDPLPGSPGASRPRSPFHRHEPWNTPSPTSPLQEGPPRQGFGGRNMFTATGRLRPGDPSSPGNQLEGLFNAVFQGMNGANGPRGQPPTPGSGGPGPMPSFQQFLSSILAPTHAAHGDVVYSEEAFDRIISQFMEAQNGTSAPGPASAAAINALPKKPVDKSMLGADGKAECSVCMDNVSLGDEVTVLPCHHWFHGDCVGAWLKEHDTCPHCRQGIMPKDSEPENNNNPVRSPGQAPQHSQPPLHIRTDGPRTFHFSYHAGSPSSARTHDHPPSRPQPRRRSSASRASGRNGGEGSSSGNGSGGGGFTSWVRSHLGGSNNGGRSSSR
ncbi:MAG: hypothetical protein LQ342_003913 [Letrouitia transgressa]|nr:MAG: hypothetical protein LQ342_003913 [Letrouitia transgressa]